MNLRETSIYLKSQLTALYSDSEAEAISDWLLAHLFGQDRLSRENLKNQSLTTDQKFQLESILLRLLQHEPLQYIINEAWFCGLKFYVDKNVLIPRPETEEIVEWIISNCKFPFERLSILDIGTGSGCIPITLKRRLRKADVWACDISEGALDVARKNAENLGAEINFTQLDFLSSEQRDELPPFDIIVSNPPYIPLHEKDGMDINVRDFEPSTALFVTDDDALVFYRNIAEFGKHKLNRNGSIYVEIHHAMGVACLKLFHHYGYQAEIKKDLQGKDRMVRASHNL